MHCKNFYLSSQWTMKIQIVSLLLVLLAAAELSEALDFFQKHVVQRMAPRECNWRMKRINNQNRKCKFINTFILDPQQELDTICSQWTHPGISYSTFVVVECIYERKKWYPMCTYRGRRFTGTNVKVVCVKRRPVHFISVDRKRLNRLNVATGWTGVTWFICLCSVLVKQCRI